MSSGYPWDFKAPYTLDYRVGPEHIDVLRHMNNAVYVGWCQEAGWKHSQELGLDIGHYRELDTAMAIRHAEYDYICAAYLGEELVLGTWLTHCDNRLQLERRFQLLRVETGETVMRGHWRLVCICLSTGKARRMPEVFKRIYGGAVVTPVSAHA